MMQEVITPSLAVTTAMVVSSWAVPASSAVAALLLATEFCPQHLIESSVIVNLSGTAYAGMDKYITNAGSSDMTPESNPEAFCPLHTAEWAAAYEALGAAITIAQGRIGSASGLLSSPYISDSDYAQLSSQINNVSSKLGVDYSTASVADINAAESQIRTASDALASTTNIVAGNIAANTPSTPPPGGGGEGEGGGTEGGGTEGGGEGGGEGGTETP